MKQSNNISNKNGYWTTPQAAKYLGVTPNYLYGLVRQRLIPYYRPIANGKIWFVVDELDIWMKKGKVEPTPIKESWTDEDQRNFIRQRLNINK